MRNVYFYVPLYFLLNFLALLEVDCILQTKARTLIKFFSKGAVHVQDLWILFSDILVYHVRVLFRLKIKTAEFIIR